MRAWIYDRLFKNLSSTWYKHVIEYLPENSKVIDVGVGTGSSLLSQLDLLRQKKLSWTGIDINAPYLASCQEKIDQLKANDFIKVRLNSLTRAQKRNKTLKNN